MTIHTVNTLSQLVVLDPTVHPNVKVLGRLQAGDGYGGLFTRDDTAVVANSASDPEDGIFVESTTLADTGWKRDLRDNFLTPYMFGGTQDETQDATTAVQAMINFVREFRSATNFEYACSLAGRFWRIKHTIDATVIRSPGFWIGNGGLIGENDTSKTSDAVVLNLTGTNSPIINDLELVGDATNPPAVGLLLSRHYIIDEDTAPGAANAKLTNVRTSGHYTKSAFINFASETSSEVNCRYFNKSISEQAFAAIYTDNMATLDEHVSGLSPEPLEDTNHSLPPAKKDPSLPLDFLNTMHLSNVLHYSTQCQYHRQAAVTLKIVSIAAGADATKAKVEVASNVDLLTGLTQLYIQEVGQISELSEFDRKKFNIVAGSIETSNNTVEIEIPFTFSPPSPIATSGSGFIRNVTGSALLVAGAKSIFGRSGYMLTYGAPSILFDCKNGSGIRQFDLNFQQEDNPDKPLKFIVGDDLPTLVQGFSVELLSNAQMFDTGVFDIEYESALGSIEFQNFHFRIANINVSSNDVKIFDTTQAKRVDLKNATIEVPRESFLNDIEDFRFFSGVMTAHDTCITRGSGMEVITPDRDGVPMKIIFNDDDNSSSEGPYFDIVRRNDTPAAQDALGTCRYIGNDDAENERVYASTRGRIMDEVSGQNSGALDIVVADSQTQTQVGQFAPFSGTVNQTALLLRYQTNTVPQFRRVTLGSTDSGGTGFRTLRVPN